MLDARWVRTRNVAAALAAAAMVGLLGVAPAQAAGGVNDFSCRPTAAHPRPVVMLHGLFATSYEDINFLQGDLAAKGYCTFAETYGAYPLFPFAGGMLAIKDSAPQIAAFVERVRRATRAAKVDLVGHSEGGFQSLYVPKMTGVGNRIGRVVAIAPPTHGTSFSGLVSLAYATLGKETFALITRTLGVPAIADLGPAGAAVTALNRGPIAQPGVAYTIITSRKDEMVTPVETSFVREPGVVNQYVQDFCPADPVGHIGEAYDANVWQLVAHGLDPDHAPPVTTCVSGLPF